MDKYNTKDLIVFDLEVYKSWFLAGFKMPDGTYYQFSTEPGGNIESLPSFLHNIEPRYTLVGFNSKRYDDAVLHKFLNGNLNPELAYQTSVAIIEHHVQSWTYNSTINSIDAMQLLPGRIGLKKVGVCLGHRKLQELPVDPHSEPTPEEIQELKKYNINDLDITGKLLHIVMPDLTLRGEMSEEYGVDLRSKGDAAMAEAILVAEYKKAGGRDTKSQLNKAAIAILDVHPSIQIFQPTWWKLLQPSIYPALTPVLNAGNKLFAAPIFLNHYRLPKGVLDQTLFLDDRYYKMGAGGLHSIDGPGAWIPVEDELLVDIDVASYYPMIALTQKLSPRPWCSQDQGDLFQPIYENLVRRRLDAKKTGDKATAYSLKIAVNGTYGKTSEMYSALLDPQVTANITVLGQLGLLSLIAMISGTGYVVSANTDGISVLLKKKNKDRLHTIVAEWEAATKLTMEYTYYKALYQRDVNNYVALTEKGALKTKGRFTDKWPDLRHTPNANIVATAINQKIQHGIELEQTIYGCNDLNQFFLTQSVSSEWTTSWNEEPLGRMLRFYKSVSPHAAPIMREPNGKQKGNAGAVANSDACAPVEDMSPDFPNDVNRQWYVNEAETLWELISQPKIPCANQWAEYLHQIGLAPCYVNPNVNTPNRARVEYGAMDFSSRPPGWVWGTATGGNLLAKVRADGTTIYWVTQPHPSRTRKTIHKKMGFTLYFGPRVPLIEPYYEILPATDDQFESYYTELEWRNLRKRIEAQKEK